MATNQVFDEANTIYGAVPVGTLSGDPVVLGQIAGVAIVDRQSDGKATIKRNGMYKFTVNAVDGGGNSAVAAGDILYHTQADPIKLSKKNTGVRFGYAGPDQAVTSGTNAIIDVIIGY